MATQLTLRQGLQRYYLSNPTFTRDQDLQLGWVTIPWQDLQRHDIMHVVTGYSTALDDEMQLVGFLLTGLSWQRPWTYYVQNIGTLLEVLWRTAMGKPVGTDHTQYRPWEILRWYGAGVNQGLTVSQSINAYLDPGSVMDQPLTDLRQVYGIENAGAWD